MPKHKSQTQQKKPLPLRRGTTAQQLGPTLKVVTLGFALSQLHTSGQTQNIPLFPGSSNIEAPVLACPTTQATQGYKLIQHPAQPQPVLHPALALLAKWLSEPSDYDKQTWPDIARNIDDHRLSDRKHFPDAHNHS